MRRDISASFQVVSQECSADELTGLIHLPDAEVHSKGDLISARSDSHYYRQSIVRIASTLPGDAPVEAHIHNLLDRLELESVSLSALPDHCVAELWVKASFEPTKFGFEVHPSTMGRLARHRIELIFSIYCE
jgi:hypothetical protein